MNGLNVTLNRLKRKAAAAEQKAAKSLHKAETVGNPALTAIARLQYERVKIGNATLKNVTGFRQFRNKTGLSVLTFVTDLERMANRAKEAATNAV